MSTFSVRKTIPLILGAVLLSTLSAVFLSHRVQAVGLESPLGGMVSVMSPALAVTIDKEICRAMNMTVGEVTVTSIWTGMTDNGTDKTLTLIPNYSPSPSPSTFRVEASVISKTPGVLQPGVWMLGLYQQEYKQVGTCVVTTTITFPPATFTTQIPFFENMGKVTMYGVSGTAL